MNIKNSKQTGILISAAIALIAGTALLANYTNILPEKTGTCSQLSACPLSNSKCCTATVNSSSKCSKSNCADQSNCTAASKDCCGQCDKSACTDKPNCTADKEKSTCTDEVSCPDTNTKSNCESQTTACCGQKADSDAK